MSQLDLLVDVPVRTLDKPAHIARAIGADAAKKCRAKAEERNPGFTLRARDFVIRYLSVNGASWGEDIVDAAAAAGIKAHDGRAWGSIFAAMSNKQIRCIRSDGVRRHGRGTSGARQWEI